MIWICDSCLEHMQRNNSKRERKQRETEKRRRDEGRVGGGGERAGKDEKGTLATTIVPDAQTNKLLVNRK